jgi:hypothetical protein
VIYGGVARTKLTAGGTFDFVTGGSSASPIRVGIDGRLTPFYAPASPY